MNNKPSAAEFMAQQSEQRGDDTGQLVDKARSLLRKSGTKWFYVKSPAQNGRKESALNISFMWKDLDAESAEMFAIGLILATMHISEQSARSRMSSLKTGVFAYFSELNARYRHDSAVINLRKPPKLRQIDERELRAFKTYLDTVHADRAVSYRKGSIEDLQFLLATIQGQPELAGLVSPDFRPLKNPYSDEADDVRHTLPIGDLDFDDIVDAALNECQAIMERDQDWQARVAESDGAFPEKNARTAFHLAGPLKREYAEKFQNKTQLGKKEVTSYRLVSPEIFREAERIIYPDERELIPFIVAIAAIYGLNPSTVLGMTVDDWKDRQVLGVHRLRLFPKKARARRRQRFEITITDDADHPYHLLEYVKRRTQPLRDLNPAYCKRLLFVRWSRKPRTVRDMIKNDPTVTNALNRFIADNRLVKFQLQQLRTTAMDRVHEVTGDLMHTQAFANHASSKTTERHYPSSARLRREQERLGRAMQLRHRDIDTDWLLTSYDLPAGMDKSAATPGFGCRNPMLGFIETEEPGRLCAAYGHCAGCKLATVDYGSARACAYLHQLRERIDEAQLVLGAEQWLARWKPVKQILLLRLDRFSDEAKAGASSVITTKIPAVE